ncbi:MAG: ABC transporter substrate-binding protein [Pseudonocardiaceae bacterium]
MTGTMDDVFESPPKRPDDPFGSDPRRPRWRNRLVIAVVGLVVIGAGGWGVDKLVHACGGLNSGVSEIDGECVGVTDGSFVFDPALADVEAKIATENERVQNSGHTVTVALLNPLTSDDTSPLSSASARKVLEGAYTAQRSVNQQGKLGDARPLIRLVLANEGSHQKQWQPVVRQLIGMVDDAAPLVAVTGLGVSITETRLGAQELAAHGIPMVGAFTTADDLTYTSIHGFVRVAPSNHEYVESLQNYLKQRPELDSAIMVFDANSDHPTNPDLFTRSLRDDLTKVMQDRLTFPSLSFTGATVPSDSSPGLFNSITPNLCAVKPKAVLYAGRQIDLRSFLQSLQGRVCPDTPITVITADVDISALKEDEPKLRKKNITVAHVAAVDQTGWLNNAPGTPPHFADFRSEFQTAGFDLADIDDGWTIGNYDALLTAVRAIRLATPPTPSATHSVPTRGDVFGQLLNMNGLNTVPGAGGDLSFSFRGHGSGNPTGKSIPVLEIPSSGSPAVSTYVTR